MSQKQNILIAINVDCLGNESTEHYLYISNKPLDEHESYLVAVKQASLYAKGCYFDEDYESFVDEDEKIQIIVNSVETISDEEASTISSRISNVIKISNEDLKDAQSDEVEKYLTFYN